MRARRPPLFLARRCGRSLEELAGYLNTAQSADVAHISACPECQAALAALKQLNRLTGELLDHDIRMAEIAEESWVQEILNNLALETRAGRNIPITADHPGDDLSETEGSVIALIRNVGDTIDGAMIGKCRLHGDTTAPGAPVDLDLRVSAFYGYAFQAVAHRLRAALEAAMATHTELNIRTINITFSDVRKAPGLPERAGP